MCLQQEKERNKNSSEILTKKNKWTKIQFPNLLKRKTCGEKKMIRISFTADNKIDIFMWVKHVFVGFTYENNWKKKQASILSRKRTYFFAYSLLWSHSMQSKWTCALRKIALKLNQKRNNKWRIIHRRMNWQASYTKQSQLFQSISKENCENNHKLNGGGRKTVVRLNSNVALISVQFLCGEKVDNIFSKNQYFVPFFFVTCSANL